jgi:mono/diheme cytochrome c family protein
MKKTTLTLLALAAVLLAWIAIAWPRAEMIPAASEADWAATPENIARGAYLARAGDCIACHTARGGAAYAGGRALETPFGRMYGPNITPDRETGIGAWSADDFWNALHNGKSRDGRLLYPAFPYTNYTKVTRADSDALFAYLQSLAPQRQPNRPHELRFPYNQQALLAAWRLLYFTPGVFAQDQRRDAQWNRGAYLVEGLGHCSACHSTRNRFGASEGVLSGGLIPTIGWYAPSLTAGAEAGLGDWDTAHIVQLLQTGVSPRGTAVGPMAEVVARSLQHLAPGDLMAMATYLKALPATPGPRAPAPPAPPEPVLAEGRKLYEQHCVDCHGANGKGLPPAYPPLAGNRAVTMEPVNAIRIVLNGGFPPGTAGNPRPYGMPPFGHVLGDREAAAVLTYLRASWGNAAAPVSALEVNRYRAVPLD